MIEKSDIEAFRREIKVIADALVTKRDAPIPGDAVAEPVPGEAIANVTLAYRHLEDASMRLGKAIQALDGGVSVYDQDQVPRSAVVE